MADMNEGVARRADEDERLYEQYGKPLENDHAGEYVAIGTMCAMGTILFLGGWLSPIPIWPLTWAPLGVFWFVGKAFFLFFMFAMVKAIVPRYRYDQLMRLGWKAFLPLSLAMVVIVAAVLQFGHLGALLAPKG